MATLTFTGSLGQAGSTLSGARSIASELTLDYSMTVPGGSTDLQFACAFAAAKVVGYFLLSDRDMTLEFNNSTTGVPAVALKAGVPVMWHDQDPHTKLFGTDVTTAYATLAAGADATLQFKVLVDPT